LNFFRIISKMSSLVSAEPEDEPADVDGDCAPDGEDPVALPNEVAGMLNSFAMRSKWCILVLSTDYCCR
jgi:hypothetical protein